MAALLTFLLVLLAGVQEPPPRSGGEIRVVTWNLENFFDRYDDPWREDERTRPPFVRESRQQRLAGVLRRLDADVVCLQEIENRFVLEDWVQRHLSALGYEVVHSEGNDGRGIDVALLSRLPVGAVTSHRHLRFPDGSGGETGFQRDLLQVRLGPPLDAEVFVVHFKSQRGGEAADRLRLEEARAAVRVLAGASPRALLAGDFNDLPESPVLQTLLEPGWKDPCAGLETPTYNQEPYRSRIDYVLLSPALARSGVRGAWILEDEEVLRASDHNPVVVDLARPRD